MRRNSWTQATSFACMRHQFFSTLTIRCAFKALFAVVVVLHLQRQSKDSPPEIILAFSAYTNEKKIFRTTRQSEQIQFFNGMKVLSVFWVIAGHRYINFIRFITSKYTMMEVLRQFASIGQF